LTGNTQIISDPKNKFKGFIEKGISDDLRERYSDVVEMHNVFNQIVEKNE